MTNHYFEEIKSNLPRILSLIDCDKTSKSYGIGDRYFWAWGLTDFGNATFQGCTHGLSRLWVSGLWPFNTSEEVFLRRINSLFKGTKFLTRQDGSLEEAFPNEGSYCVTALVAFDLLVTIDLLSEKINDEQRQDFVETVRPLINYLKKSDETHAIISNHLATAVAALVRWDILVDDAKAFKKAEHLLERILSNQSEEGWFMEYEGADPGYQTLCLHYIADVHLQRRDFNLLETIQKSIRFLQYFAHPDGSFGGHYGSRCTRFYYPSGILAMAQEIPEASILDQYMQNSISEKSVVGLSSMDEPNLIPMFNSYAWSASLEKNLIETDKVHYETLLPCRNSVPFRKDFKAAGILIDRGKEHYSIINYKKGGVTYHFINNKLEILNSGIVLKSQNGKLGSNQFYDVNQCISFKKNSLKIRNQIAQMPRRLTKPLQFLLLRILCISFFRISSLRELVKKILVKYLITKPKLLSAWNTREVQLGKDLKITDTQELVEKFTLIDKSNSFIPIHMASQEYWQIQEEQKN